MNQTVQLLVGVPLLALVLVGRERVIRRLRPKSCPACGHSGIRLLHRTRLTWAGLLLAIWGFGAGGAMLAVAFVGCFLAYLAPLDEPRLWCPACRQGAPVRPTPKEAT